MQTTIVPKFFFVWGGGGEREPKETNSLSFSYHALSPMLRKVSIHCPISLGGHTFLGIKTLLAC